MGLPEDKKGRPFQPPTKKLLKVKVSLKPSSFSQSPIKQPQMRAFPICGPNFLVKGKRVKVSMKPSSFYVDEIHLVKGEPFDQKGRIFLVVMAFLGLNLWGRCWLKKKKMNPKGDGFIKTVVLSNVPWGGKTVVPFKTQNRRPREDGKTVVLFGDNTIILFECFSFFGHQFKGTFLVKKGLGRKPRKNWPMVLQLSFSHQLIYIYIYIYYTI